MNRLSLTVAVSVPLLLALVTSSLGQDSPAQLQQALNRPVDLELTNVRIGELFKTLEESTGVSFVLDDEVLAYLPYGSDTRIDATVKNATLRQALGPILAKQGLKWEVDGEHIAIRPTEALIRMCKRATFEELTVLGKLSTVRLESASQAGSVVDQLKRTEGLEKVTLLPHGDIDTQAEYARADKVLPGTAARWLDLLCHGHDWTWFVSGNRIVIIDKADQVHRQLKKKVTLSYKDTSLTLILLDLARQAHVGLTMSPGVMNYIPSATSEHFNLTMGEATVEQALQVISGATSLEFVVTAQGVEARPSEGLLAASAAAQPQERKRTPFFVQMSLPGPNGVTIEVFMRPEELPEDVVQMIEEAKEDFIAQLRGEALEAEDTP